MGGRYFVSLDDVIQRYRGEQIVAGFKLGQPVLRNTLNAPTPSSSSLSSALLATNNNGHQQQHPLHLAHQQLQHSHHSHPQHQHHNALGAGGMMISSNGNGVVGGSSAGLFGTHCDSADLGTSSGFGSLLSNSSGSGLVCAVVSAGRSCGSFSLLSGCESSGGSALSCSSIDQEQIYATLRESREKTQAQRLKQKLSAYLHKKSQRTKKWKNFFFVLSPDEQTLCFYETERKVRPKGLIDLSFSYLYLVHESLFDKPYCVQLVEKALPCISSVHFICFPNLETMQEWVQAIRPLGTQQQSLCHHSLAKSTAPNSHCSLPVITTTNSSSSTVTNEEERAVQIRTLHLTLLEARRLPVKLTPHPFCLISLNKQKVARTSVKCPPDPIYEEDFILEEIPADITYFSITLFNKGKRSKDNEVAEFSVELNRLVSGEEVEDWFSLSGLMPTREDMGSIRLRIRYVNELILPTFEYAALRQLLLEDTSLEVLSLLEDLCQKDRAPLAQSLLQVLVRENAAARVLGRLVEREVARETDSCTLFRMNSLTTALMDGFMRMFCGRFLNGCLRVTLQRILANKHSCELNPSRLDSLSAACANAEHLLQLLDQLVERIFSNLHLWPSSVRYVCACVQRAVQLKWPDNQSIRTQAVGSFIFLRLICPAILNPRQFNLISGEFAALIAFD